MPGGKIISRLILALTAGFLFSPSASADKIVLCSAGAITMGPFDEHLATIREANRYDKDDIDKLIADQKTGGADFFSTQVVIKEEQSGSGTFDLNLFQGFFDPKAKYRSTVKWHCGHDDYPVAYFVGFKVKEIYDGTVFVSREKETVNVVSLKKIDPALDKHTKVVDAQSRAVLCDDIAEGCVKTIFYGRY